jgi:hypothetical protein
MVKRDAVLLQESVHPQPVLETKKPNALGVGQFH